MINLSRQARPWVEFETNIAERDGSLRGLVYL